MKLYTVQHTGTKYIMECAVRAGKPLIVDHFLVNPVPSDASKCVTIVRDRRLTLASWIHRNEINRKVIEGISTTGDRGKDEVIKRNRKALLKTPDELTDRLTREWEAQDDLIRRGAMVANTPEEAALILGIPEDKLIKYPVDATDSLMKRAILAGEEIPWPAEYKEFAESLNGR